MAGRGDLTGRATEEAGERPHYGHGQEHEAVAVAMREMRRLTADYTPPENEAACNTYRGLLDGLQRFEADTHQHIHLENNILFPKAIELQESLPGS